MIKNYTALKADSKYSEDHLHLMCTRWAHGTKCEFLYSPIMNYVPNASQKQNTRVFSFWVLTDFGDRTRPTVFRYFDTEEELENMAMLLQIGL